MQNPSDFYIHRLISRLTNCNTQVLRYHGRPTTGEELLSSIRSYASHLLRFGIGPSRIVGIYAPNKPEALAVRYAASWVGAAYFYLPLHADASSRLAIIKNARLDILLVFEETGWALDGLDIEYFRDLKVVSVGVDVQGLPRLDLTSSRELDDESSPNTSAVPVAVLEPDAICCIVSSGGSTGHVKASWRTHRQYTALTNIPIPPDRRQLINGPFANLSHVMADGVIMGGGTVILDDDFEPGRMLQLAEKENVTDFFLTESQLALLLDHPTLQSTNLSKVRAITHVGENAPQRLREKAVAAFGINRMIQSYGASEASVSAIFSGDRYLTIPPRMSNPCGTLVPGVEVRILSPVSGETLPDGQPGRIEIKGAAVASGYWPELTEPLPAAPRFRHHGRILMNDIGIKHDNSLEFLGREEDVVYLGRWGEGEPTTAILLQDVLLKLESRVKYAAVFRGIKHGRWVAALVLQPGSAVDVGEVEKHLQAEYRVDRISVLIMERLPLTPQGKVDRQQVLSRLGAPEARTAKEH